MFDIRVFNALATQTSVKIGQISFNVTTPVVIPNPKMSIRKARCEDDDGPFLARRYSTRQRHKP